MAGSLSGPSTADRLAISSRKFSFTAKAHHHHHDQDCRILLSDVKHGTKEADGCIVAFLPPACLSDQPGCTPIFAKNFSDKISHFLKTGKLGNLHTCLSGQPARFYWFSVVLTKCSFNMCTNMVITTTSASFCALVGECQQKFLLGGAFYSPNERFSPNVPLPSLNVIFPDIIITA